MINAFFGPFPGISEVPAKAPCSMMDPHLASIFIFASLTYKDKQIKKPESSLAACVWCESMASDWDSAVPLLNVHSSLKEYPPCKWEIKGTRSRYPHTFEKYLNVFSSVWGRTNCELNPTYLSRTSVEERKNRKDKKWESATDVL